MFDSKNRFGPNMMFASILQFVFRQNSSDVRTKFSFGGQQVVAEHVLFGSIIVPGVVYTEMALEAVRRGAAARRD